MIRPQKRSKKKKKPVIIKSTQSPSSNAVLEDIPVSQTGIFEIPFVSFDVLSTVGSCLELFTKKRQTEHMIIFWLEGNSTFLTHTPKSYLHMPFLLNAYSPIYTHYVRGIQ